MATKNKYFTEDDLARISAAVKAAESKTSGEIVPFFVPQSDDYEEATWRGAVMFGALPLAILAFLRLFSDYWLATSALRIILLFFSTSILGALLVRFIPRMRCFFAGKDLLQHRVSLRASRAFVSEEVFKTRDRTGILIFLSFMERIVVVLGDSGINAKVQQSDWDGIVQTIVGGMKTKQPAEGLIRAIGQCGELLQKHGVARKSDDSDELSDQLRIKDK